MPDIEILLAEDHEPSQAEIMELLRQNGFERITAVRNGEEAVRIAAKKKFDLIIMDMQMPIMNGFEATEKIRLMRKHKRVPIIALSVFAMKHDKKKCVETGATDLVAKPVSEHGKEFIKKMRRYTNTN